MVFYQVWVLQSDWSLYYDETLIEVALAAILKNPESITNNTPTNPKATQMPNRSANTPNTNGKINTAKPLAKGVFITRIKFSSKVGNYLQPQFIEDTLQCTLNGFNQF